MSVNRVLASCDAAEKYESKCEENEHFADAMAALLMSFTHEQENVRRVEKRHFNSPDAPDSPSSPATSDSDSESRLPPKKRHYFQFVS